MKRLARLQSAKSLGLHLLPERLALARYRRRFRVDGLCSLRELQVLGMAFSDELRASVEQAALGRQARRRKVAVEPAPYWEFWGEDLEPDTVDHAAWSRLDCPGPPPSALAEYGDELFWAIREYLLTGGRARQLLEAAEGWVRARRSAALSEAPALLHHGNPPARSGG